MKLQIQSRALYRMPQALTALLQIEAANLPLQVVENESLRFSPEVKSDEFIDVFGNRNRRFCAAAGDLEMLYEATVELSESPHATPETAEVAVADLPPDVLVLTLPSRYCESDRLAKVALDLFGHLPPGANRVFSICEWIRNHVTYEYGHTTSSTSAFDMVTERIGVCRDFSHLAIAFCRALNI
ncbi:MAG TPA: transglutaminase family protein, partial [Abditibacteriaceae bacterium]